MKTSFLTPALAAALLIGGGGLALAEAQMGQMGHMGKMEQMGHGMGMQPGFEELDADGDGRITPEEMAAHRQARFEGADSDGDGALSRDELISRMIARQAERMAAYADHMIERHDADGNGLLSPDEMKAGGGGKMFRRADADGDGAISRAEFDEMRAQMQSRHEARKAKK